VTNSGQLQGILTENEGILSGPAIKPKARNLVGQSPFRQA